MIRVFLVENEALIRAGLRELLNLAGGISLIGEAASGAEALRLIPESEADIVLMDVRMPVMDGPATLMALRHQGFAKPVIFITTFDDEQALLAAMKAGAQGYLRKDISLEQLKHAMEEVLAGKTVLRPTVTLQSLDRLRALAPAFEASDLPEALTPREVEVLRLIAAGYSNKEIADLLGNTEGTVKSHTSTILSKLGVRDRTRAVLRALELGWI